MKDQEKGLDYCLYSIQEIKGENAFLIPTFWVNFHFGPKIDFVTNVVPKKRKLILFWSLPLTH